MLTLTLDPQRYAVCQFARLEDVPPRGGADFYALTLARDEISLVCAETQAPPGARCESGWRLLKLEGPFDFGLVGILAGVLNPLAQAGVSIFALSTYATDYVMVKDAALAAALDALRGAGHTVQPSG